MQLVGTGNTYTGGTTLEIGTALQATVANLTSAAGQTITNAGGTLVLDQTAGTGDFTATMTDGKEAGTGPTLSGSFVETNSGNTTGNITMANAQSYSGATTVEAGTLMLGATDTVATSSGVTLGTVGGGATAKLALGATNHVKSLNSVTGNTTGVLLNGNALTVQQASGGTSNFAGTITDTGAGSVTTTGAVNLALSGTDNVGGTVSLGSGGTLSQTGGSLSVGGNVTNNGSISVSHATATYGGTFTNSGMYFSDPSTQTFNNLTVTANGWIQASPGDTYKVGGSFLNTSTQSQSWNTTGATLEFISGSTMDHTLQLVAANGGATLPIQWSTFAWNTLTIDPSNEITLEGQNGGGSFAMYVNNIIGAVISGDTVTNIFGSTGLDIYYNPYLAADAHLQGKTYDLTGGGLLIADVPEPTSFALLLTGLTGGIVARRRARAASKVRSAEV